MSIINEAFNENKFGIILQNKVALHVLAFFLCRLRAKINDNGN